MLLLISAVSALGLGMVTGLMPDIGALHRFLHGTWRMEIVALEAHGALLAHMGGALLLLLTLPFSKLLHAPAVFFSPTLNQVER